MPKSTPWTIPRREWLRIASAIAAASAAGTGPSLLAATQADASADADDGASVDVPWLAEVQRPPDSGQSIEGAPELREIEFFATSTEAGDNAPVQQPSAQAPDSNEPTVSPEALSVSRRRLADWLDARNRLRTVWLAAMGYRHPGRQPPAWRVLESERLAGVVRQRIGYESQVGWEVEAYLLFPDRLDQRRRGYVVLHSTVQHSILQPAGLVENSPLALALDLARRGHVAIAPRNFLWPTNDAIDAQARADAYLAQFPGSTGIAKMLLDSQVALNLLASLPSVDPRRLGVVGHSLGAKEALYLAAMDERVRVAVSCEGGIGLEFSNWDAPWYWGPKMRQPSWTRDHHELLALVAPRAFLLIGGESADGDRSWPYLEKALPAYQLYQAAGLTPAMRLGMINHRQGHALPADQLPRVWEWLETYAA